MGLIFTTLVLGNMISLRNMLQIYNTIFLVTLDQNSAKEYRNRELIKVHGFGSCIINFIWGSNVSERAYPKFLYLK